MLEQPDLNCSFAATEHFSKNTDDNNDQRLSSERELFNVHHQEEEKGIQFPSSAWSYFQEFSILHSSN